jgi:glutaredoxin 2
MKPAKYYLQEFSTMESANKFILKKKEEGFIAYYHYINKSYKVWFYIPGKV